MMAAARMMPVKLVRDAPYLPAAGRPSSREDGRRTPALRNGRRMYAILACMPATIMQPFLVPPAEETFVGEVRVPVLLENSFEARDARRGRIPESDVHRVRRDLIVDTGASSLVLPEEIVEALALDDTGVTEVRYADNRIVERPLAGMVTLHVAGRKATVECLVGERGTEPLLGQIVLEITDLLVDCNNRRLVPHPDRPTRTRYNVLGTSAGR